MRPKWGQDRSTTYWRGEEAGLKERLRGRHCEWVVEKGGGGRWKKKKRCTLANRGGCHERSKCS